MWRKSFQHEPSGRWGQGRHEAGKTCQTLLQVRSQGSEAKHPPARRSVVTPGSEPNCATLLVILLMDVGWFPCLCLDQQPFMSSGKIKDPDSLKLTFVRLFAADMQFKS